MLPQLRKQLLACLVISSQAHSRRKNRSKAIELIESIEHRFFDTKIPRAEFGPESIEFRKTIATALDSQLRGTLVIEAPKGSDIYVESALVGASAAFLKLRGGSYSVFAAIDGLLGKPRIVKVPPGKIVRVTLRTKTARQRAVFMANKKGKELAVVVAVSEDGKQIVGEAISAKGKTLRRVEKSVKATTADIDAFVLELTRGGSTTSTDLAHISSTSSSEPRFSATNKILQSTFIGLGPGVLAVGVFAVASSETDARLMRDNVILLGTGAGGVVIGGLFRWPFRF